MAPLSTGTDRADEYLELDKVGTRLALAVGIVSLTPHPSRSRQSMQYSKDYTEAWAAKVCRCVAFLAWRWLCEPIPLSNMSLEERLLAPSFITRGPVLSLIVSIGA